MARMASSFIVSATAMMPAGWLSTTTNMGVFPSSETLAIPASNAVMGIRARSMSLRLPTCTLPRDGGFDPVARHGLKRVWHFHFDAARQCAFNNRLRKRVLALPVCNSSEVQHVFR